MSENISGKFFFSSFFSNVFRRVYQKPLLFDDGLILVFLQSISVMRGSLNVSPLDCVYLWRRSAMECQTAPMPRMKDQCVYVGIISFMRINSIEEISYFAWNCLS